MCLSHLLVHELRQLGVRRREGSELVEITVEWLQSKLASISSQEWSHYVTFLPVHGTEYHEIEVKEEEKEGQPPPPPPPPLNPSSTFYTGENYNIPFQPLNKEISNPCAISGCKSPLQFFSLFILPSDLSALAAATNQYASSIQENFITNINEVRIWIALSIHMGIVKLTRFRQYWSASYKNEKIFSHMSRDRYTFLKKCFRPSSSPSIAYPSTHPFHIILPFVSPLPYRFRRHIAPSTYLSLDESMIAFKSWTPARQFMPDKPIKLGYKAFTLAIDKGGYILDFWLYPGQYYMLVNQVDSSMSALVERVAHHYLNKHHVLVMDRYFTSKSHHSHAHLYLFFAF